MINQIFVRLRKREREEGFTLVELMIVVVIIGILAAIAIPIFMNQQRAAGLAALESDAKNVITMASTFKTLNDGRFPEDCSEWDQAVPPGWTSDTTTLFRVKTSADGFSLWIEAQPTTIQSSDSAALKAENTVVYNSNNTQGLTTRAEYASDNGYPLGTNLSIVEGYTTSGYRLNVDTGCEAW